MWLFESLFWAGSRVSDGTTHYSSRVCMRTMPGLHPRKAEGRLDRSTYLGSDVTATSSCCDPRVTSTCPPNETAMTQFRLLWVHVITMTFSLGTKTMGSYLVMKRPFRRWGVSLAA